jgi:ketosteroid isomerase-like protein
LSDIEEQLRFYFNALNAYDLKTVEDMFAEDAVYVSSGLREPIKGRVKIMEAFQQYFDEYDDQVSIDTNIKSIAPNIFSSDWSLKATSRKNGKPLERAGTQITTFNDTGLIAHVEVRDIG